MILMVHVVNRRSAKKNPKRFITPTKMERTINFPLLRHFCFLFIFLCNIKLYTKNEKFCDHWHWKLLNANSNVQPEIRQRGVGEGELKEKHNEIQQRVLIDERRKVVVEECHRRHLAKYYSVEWDFSIPGKRLMGKVPDKKMFVKIL